MRDLAQDRAERAAGVVWLPVPSLTHAMMEQLKSPRRKDVLHYTSRFTLALCASALLLLCSGFLFHHVHGTGDLSSNMQVVLRHSLSRTGLPSNQLIRMMSERHCHAVFMTGWPPVQDFWTSMVALKQQLPKDPYWQRFDVATLKKKLPIWVMSLPGAEQRRKHMLAGMQQAGVTEFTFQDGINGSDPAAVSTQEMEMYFAGGLKEGWLKGETRARRKVAADIGHFRMLQRVVSGNSPVLIFEDDGTPVENFYEKLLPTLQELPCDWDLLFLNACFYEARNNVTEHLVTLRSAHCLLGYMPSVRFAKAALEYRDRTPSMRIHPIDVQFNLMIRDLQAQAYIADPRLVKFAPALPSIIENL